MWALRSVQRTTSSVLRSPIQVRKNSPETKKPSLYVACIEQNNKLKCK